MIINWTHFSPWAALLGGALIGIAASLMILLNGRVLGVSGIVGGLHLAKSGWRFAFVTGILGAPIAYQLLFGLPPSVVDTSNWLIVLAGLLVGFGSRLGSGCTSGHGVCGLARFSPRSLTAVVSFMAAGFITVYVIRHILNWS